MPSTNDENNEMPPIPAPQSTDDIEQLMAELQLVQLAIDNDTLATDARVMRLVEAMRQRQAPREKYRDALVETISAYALAHKVSLTHGTQTAELRHGTLSWRKDGRGALVLLKDEDEVIADVERFRGKRFIVVKKSLKRDALKSDPDFVGKVPSLDIEYRNTFSITLRQSPAELRTGRQPVRFTRQTS